MIQCIMVRYTLNIKFARSLEYPLSLSFRLTISISSEKHSSYIYKDMALASGWEISLIGLKDFKKGTKVVSACMRSRSVASKTFLISFQSLTKNNLLEGRDDRSSGRLYVLEIDRNDA